LFPALPEKKKFNLRDLCGLCESEKDFNSVNSASFVRDIIPFNFCVN
jgi:hypothetical protein